MKKLSILIFIFCLASLQYACKRCNDPGNPDCKNYDPCYGKTAASADFDIFERGRWRGGSNWIETKSDTIIYDSFAVFRANQSENNDLEYSWKIGFMEKEFTEPEVSLQFMEDVFGQTLPIRLIVTKKQGQTCITNPHELRDTVIKFLHITSPQRSRIFGKYVGEQLNRDFTKINYTLEITPLPDSLGEYTNWPEHLLSISFKNINNLGCYEDAPILYDQSIFYKAFRGGSAYDLYCDVQNYRIRGLFIDSLSVNNDEIYLKFMLNLYNSEGQGGYNNDWKIFSGKRIQ
jgi:hypothetical protein